MTAPTLAWRRRRLSETCRSGATRLSALSNSNQSAEYPPSGLGSFATSTATFSKVSVLPSNAKLRERCHQPEICAPDRVTSLDQYVAEELFGCRVAELAGVDGRPDLFVGKGGHAQGRPEGVVRPGAEKRGRRHARHPRSGSNVSPSNRPISGSSS